RLTRRPCRDLEPVLPPPVRGGVLAPDDHPVAPRRLLLALPEAGSRTGVTEIADRVVEVTENLEVVLAGGRTLSADRVVLAAGCWGNDITTPTGVLPTLRPVKGQLLRTRLPADQEPLVHRTVRGLVRGNPIYFVPRDDGEIVVGATQEEHGHDTALTVGGLWHILRDARELVPGATELEVTEPCVGL